MNTPPGAYRFSAGAGFGWGAMGWGTRTLTIAVLLFSVISAVLTRAGVPVQPLAIFEARAVIPGLELWRLVTYLFLETSVLGLLLTVLMLWFLGGWFEQRYGTQAYLQFFILAGIGAALLSVPLTYLFNLLLGWTNLYRELGIASGPDAVFDAILMAMALVAPNSNVLLGFVLPMKIRTVIYLVIGFQILSGLLHGSATIAITLSGLLMGYLLVTGWWRPRRWAHWWRTRRTAQKSQRFTVIDGQGGKPPRYFH